MTFADIIILIVLTPIMFLAVRQVYLSGKGSCAGCKKCGIAKKKLDEIRRSIRE